MEKRIEIILFDLKNELITVWNNIFKDSKYNFITRIKSDFKDLKGSAIVSPANSFGFMNGGIDAAYIQYYGESIETILQNIIKENWNGELPIGCAEFTNIPFGKNVDYLISAPTMRVPMNIAITPNVYLATRAALIKFKEIISEENFEKNIILIPGMGTGVGSVDYNLCAMQMKKAIDHTILNEFEFPETINKAYSEHVRLLAETTLYNIE